MKKIKIMLTAITVLAVVGGALAFKAKTISERNVYCYLPNETVTCQLKQFKTQENGDPVFDICAGDFFYTTNTCPDATKFDDVEIPVYTVNQQ